MSKQKKVVVLFDAEGLRITADADRWIADTSETVQELTRSTCDNAGVEYDDEAIAKMIRTEIARRTDEFELGLVTRSRALAQEQNLRLVEAVWLAVLERLSGDLGEPMMATDYAAARRPIVAAIKKLQRVAAQAVARRRRGGTTRIKKPLTDTALRSFAPTVTRFRAVCKDLLAMRRRNPGEWRAAAGDLTKQLTADEETAILNVIEKIGDTRSSINSAPIQPLTCARETARILLGIEGRSDSELRKIQNQSRRMN